MGGVRIRVGLVRVVEGVHLCVSAVEYISSDTWHQAL